MKDRITTASRVSLGWLAALACFIQPAFAVDAVTRLGTKVPIKGEVTAVSRKSVTVKMKTRTVEIPADEVVSIRWTGEPPTAGLGRSIEAAGQWPEAVEAYQKALAAAKPGDKRLKADLRYLIGRVSAKIALANTSGIDKAIGLLEAVFKADSNSFRYYEGQEYLGRLYAAKKDWSKAETAFKSLEAAPWDDYKMSGQIGRARLLLQRDGPAAAIPAFDAVIGNTATGPRAESRRLQAMLGKSECLQAEKKLDESLLLLNDVIARAPTNDAALQAKAYLRQGNNLAALGKPREAVLAILHVDLLFFKVKDAHAESLYQLAHLWEQLGEKGRADDARSRLQTLFPPENYWRKQSATASGE